ncbi:hypothetical protein [Nonomuraea sp. 10N515B]|uniref:hypothetical protein n=1 Tax=Nonomuraea sp. 10N515B TaxID=3457422 RepID=UPI003FCCA1B8
MVGRHGRKAALPPSGFTRPPSLSSDGLRVTVFEEDGTVGGVCDFTQTPNGRVIPGSLELRRAFAAAFDRKSGPGGTWRSFSTCLFSYRAIYAFLEFASQRQEPLQAPEGITAACWDAWVLQLPAGQLGRMTAHRVQALLNLIPGVAAETLKVVNRRLGVAPRRTPPSYSYEEYEQIRSSAAAIFNTALVRIRTNRDLLRRWYAGEIPHDGPDWLVGEALHWVLTTGDVPLYPNSHPSHRYVVRKYDKALGGRGPGVTWARLFPTRVEALAAGTLLVASEAWNRAPLNQMLVPDHDPAAGEEEFDIHMVEIDKRRRPVHLRHTTNNLLDAGPGTPGRLMGQVIEATDLAREHLRLQGRPTNRLLVWRRLYSGGVGKYFALGIPNQKERDPDLDDYHPHNVSLRRLRRTVQVLIRKEPAQNTQTVHDDVYVMGDPQLLGEVRDTVAQGLTDAVEHARIIMQMRVVLGEDADELIELSDDPELAREIADGLHDTPTAACTGLTSSPFTEPGLPCTASFLMCLACPNAVATKRHLPRLAYLHHTLNDLRTVLDTEVWERDWREHFQRLDSLPIDEVTQKGRVPRAQWDQARAQITDADRGLIDRMLTRKLEAT